MARKGKIAEIFSKALYKDNPNLYSIGYIDLGEIKETTFQEFLKLSENFEVIPASRIVYIKKESKVLYSKIKNRKESDQF
jgi:uncharacterized protein (UPF0248 family)